MAGVSRTGTNSLRNLHLRVAYDTDEHDVVRDFYNPSLACAVSYDRLAGFFSSSALGAAARGIAGLVRNGGKMRLVASPKLSSEDVAAIEAGTRSASEVATEAALRSIEHLEGLLSEDQTEALSWLVANNHLEVKLAVPTNPSGMPVADAALVGAMFHQKVGIIRDAQGDRIAFSGSVNETLTGWTRNIEEFKVFRSWEPGELPHLDADEAKFEKYWNGKARQTLSIDVSQAIQQKLITYLPRKRATQPSAVPSPQALWKHQEEAIANFITARAGILEMATGTGKTRTALTIAQKLLREDHVDSLIIASVGNDLLQQWYREVLGGLGDDSVLIRREFGEWKEGRAFFLHKSSLPTVLITSYDNLGDLLTPERMDRVKRTMIICDEIHNAGSEKRANDLRGKLNQLPFRLGLSATPERAFDQEGSAFIEKEVGPVLYRFGLEDAIRAGILCEFDYIPNLYAFDDEDREKIPAAYARHAARKRLNPRASPEELYRDLANIRKESKAKLPLFARYLSKNPRILDRAVIFVATVEYGHLVQEIIHKVTTDYHTYYGEDDEVNLDRFARGELNTLVTCKRISEGIDVRSIRNVILFASDRARLQTTQRIGRCLRKDPSDPHKRAAVVDFVLRDDVQPTDKPRENDYVPVDAERYDWLYELSRMKNGA